MSFNSETISFILVMIFAGLLLFYLLYILFLKIYALRYKFMNEEPIFDDKYFEKRKNFLFDTKFVYFSYKYAKIKKFKDLDFVKDSVIIFDWYSKFSDYDVDMFQVVFHLF